jgi:hypothetical protein
MKQAVFKQLTRLSALLCLLMTTATVAAQTTVDESQVTILPSISSTGAQAFNTHYTHKANTRVVMDCNVTQNSQRSWEALFGARLKDYRYNAFCFFSRNQHNIPSPVDKPCFNRSGVETDGDNFVFGERIILTCEGQTAAWVRYSDPSTVVSSVTTTGNPNEGKTPMFFFELNTSSTEGGLQEDKSKSVMTLYGCKIYEGETLKCDFVPAKYNNVVGLYDRVRKTFSGSLTDTPFFVYDFAGYERALAAIEDGHSYRVFTEVSGLKYYVTADGYLTTDMADAPAFQFNKVAGYEYKYGFQLKNGNICFTNPETYTVEALTKGCLNTTEREEPRPDWEAQVFFLNEEGKYAIRSTNAQGGHAGWSWIGCAYWTVNEGPKAEYSFDMNYVWQLEDGDIPIPVTNETTVLKGNLTYVVESNVTLSTRIKVEGKPTLILGDGTTLNAPMGIQVSDVNWLTIEGSGALVANAEGDNAAIGGDLREGCGSIIINGGQITVNNDGYTGIGYGRYGRDNSGSLSLGWTYPSDYVLINTCNIQNYLIRFAEGKSFLIDGTETEATASTLVGNKLVPKTDFFITENTTVMGDGCTYYMNADVTNNNRIKVIGSAVLHLNEGYKLTATRGFQVEGENTLTIEGDGRLIATADKYDAAIGGGCSNGNEIRCADYGHIIINGGYISATGGENAAGIGGGVINHNRQGNSTITINGGYISATGGKNAAGIGGGFNYWYAEPGNEDIGTPGTIAINGGQVTAFGGGDSYNQGYRCSGIGYGSQGADNGQLTLGWTNPSDFIEAINGYGFSNIAFVEGKRFIVEGTYEEITLENFDDVKWNKLLPIVARDPISITSETTVLEGNLTYVVDSDVTLSNRLRVKGTPTLLLNEGKTLTAPMGIQVAQDVATSTTGVLTIEGSGALTAIANNGDAAIGGDVGQACGNIYINGGQITATGSGNSVGGGAGQGGDNSGEIRLSWTNPTDFVYINSLKCTYSHLTDDKPFLVDDTGEQANNGLIAGNKLVAYPQCATPTIVYKDGKLLFESETEGVEFVSHFSTPEGAEGNGSEVSVSTVYTLAVYAKKYRYRDSETVTKDIDIRGLAGDSNGDGKITISDAVGIVNAILGNK